MQDISRYKLKI